MRLARHVACIREEKRREEKRREEKRRDEKRREENCVYNFGKTPDGKRSLGREKRRCEVIIKKDVKEV
jgi:hypothetical protein